MNVSTKKLQTYNYSALHKSTKRDWIYKAASTISCINVYSGSCNN